MGTNKFIVQQLLYFIFFFLLVAVISSNVSAKSQQVVPEPPSFSTALREYLIRPDTHNKEQLLHSVSSFTIGEIDDLLNNFGKDSIIEALKYLPNEELNQLLHKYGQDFVVVALHHTISAKDQLEIIKTHFPLEEPKVANSALETKSRFTGGLMILEDIKKPIFNSLLQVFSKEIVAEAFLEAFYEDPYLFASAINTISKSDQAGSRFRSFCSLFADKSSLSELFKKDLAGLVVAYSTIIEVTDGKDLNLIKKTLNITDEHLSQLLIQKPVNLAYILYGGQRLGVDNFKNIINSVGPDRFAAVLNNHSGWFANFLFGMKSISPLSVDVDFKEIYSAQRDLNQNHSYPEDFDVTSSFNKKVDPSIFENLPATDEFLQSEDIGAKTRMYLLGLLSVYQSFLNEKLPSHALTPLQFDLLRQQIIYSTRYSNKLDNITSNFEVGRRMVKNLNMETIILLLAHELAHQIYSIRGFDAPLLSATTIHECGADIAAHAVAKQLNFTVGLTEYVDMFVKGDDYSAIYDLSEDDLIMKKDPHKIGRTQLGYLVKAFTKQGIPLNWEQLFLANLTVVDKKEKMKHFLYVKDLVGMYILSSSGFSKSETWLKESFKQYSENYSSENNNSSKQIADISSVEEMITIAMSVQLQALNI